jgi:hypothetical protein
MVTSFEYFDLKFPLGPYWSYDLDESSKKARWFLKDFGSDSLGLRFSDETLNVYCPKNWSIAQEEFAGHYSMHAWCKRYKVDINDDQSHGFTVYFDGVDSNVNLAVIDCVSSITENIELTLFFYEINKRIKAEPNG